MKDFTSGVYAGDWGMHYGNKSPHKDRNTKCVMGKKSINEFVQRQWLDLRESVVCGKDVFAITLSISTYLLADTAAGAAQGCYICTPTVRVWVVQGKYSLKMVNVGKGCQIN